MQLVAAIQLFAALLGHAAIGCAAYNQAHAHSWPSPGRKWLDRVLYLAWLALALCLIASSLGQFHQELVSVPLKIYQWLCIAAAMVVMVRWGVRCATARRPSRLQNHRSEVWDLRPELSRTAMHGWQARWLQRIPGNQVLCPVAEFRSIELRGLPPQSDGLRLVQLSDLHFNGKVGLEFFQRAVERCNQLNPDLVALTGDVVDHSRYLEWIPSVLGNVTARYGRFYVLGNHDRRAPDVQSLRSAMAKTGFEPLLGRWERVAIPGGCLWLCGNELPWYSGAESLPQEPPSDPGAPRILLSHTPDHFRWAQSRRIDLMLSGHCHGGQIRLPWIGPIISPSRHGVRFASGGFEFGGMSLWVSRGLSADEPIRLNCPPEISVYDLRVE
jgi:predicted MPP superfamily phosphohydrolase